MKIIYGILIVFTVLISTKTIQASPHCLYVLNKTSGEIKSTSSACKWTIINDAHHALIFRITAMSFSCQGNFLQIGKNTRQYCGNLTNNIPIASVSSSGQNVTVKYNKLDNDGKGFKLEFFKVKLLTPYDRTCPTGQFTCKLQYCLKYSWKCNGVKECPDGSDELSCNPDDSNTCRNKELISLSGTFHSPNFPNAYPHSAYCDWTINVMKGQKILLSFDKFFLEGDDTITIFDGPTQAYSLIDVFSRTNYPQKMIESSNHTLFVQFQSQTIAVGKGFNATYKVKGFCLGDTNLFNCEYGENNCFSKKQQCDGKWDCVKHGRDERGCGTCPQHKFACSKGSSQCYEEVDRCNGQGHCVNSADELNCTSDKCGPQSGTFLCQNSRCIIESWRCDGANDCEDNSDELGCSGVASRKVITAAVVGALSCSLLLVVALGCTCRLHAMRMREVMGGSYVSPLSRLQEEIWARRSAPPLYDEAMQTSRPYDEMVAVIEEALANRGSIPAESQDSDVEMLQNGISSSNEQSDDELIDVSQSHGNDEDQSSIGGSNVEITLLAGASAQWRRGTNVGNRSRAKIVPEADGKKNQQSEPDFNTDVPSTTNSTSDHASIDTASAASNDYNNVIKTCDNNVDSDSNDDDMTLSHSKNPDAENNLLLSDSQKGGDCGDDNINDAHEGQDIDEDAGHDDDDNGDDISDHFTLPASSSSNSEMIPDLIKTSTISGRSNKETQNNTSNIKNDEVMAGTACDIHSRSCNDEDIRDGDDDNDDDGLLVATGQCSDTVLLV